MPDGTILNLQAGGDLIDTEDLGARGKMQRVKFVIGALDADDGDISAANPLPVGGIHYDGIQTLTDGQKGKILLDEHSYVQVVDMGVRPGADSTRNVQKVEKQLGLPMMFTAAIAQTNIVNKACNLHRVVIGNPGSVAAVITLQDGTSTPACPVITTVPGTGPVTIDIDAMLQIGLYITITGGGSGLQVGVFAD